MRSVVEPFTTLPSRRAVLLLGLLTGIAAGVATCLAWSAYWG